MSKWDVFHDNRMQRGLDTDAVRAALAAGTLRAEALVRPVGSTAPWSRIAEVPELIAPVLERDTGPRLRTRPEPTPVATVTEDEEVVELGEPEGAIDLNLDPDHRLDVEIDNPVSQGGFHYSDREELEPLDPQDEDEEAAEFTLSRGSADKIEELDLAAMVDVAFQLVLFFLVTATTVLYKSLEVPKPNPEQQQETTQGAKSLNDMQKDYILVEIDSQGAIKVDREAVAPEALIEKLRKAREDTARKSMLLSADFKTQHRLAVVAYDAASEIGLSIAIARPVEPPPGAAPAPAPAAKKAG